MSNKNHLQTLINCPFFTNFWLDTANAYSNIWLKFKSVPTTLVINRWNNLCLSWHSLYLTNGMFICFKGVFIVSIGILIVLSLDTCNNVDVVRNKSTDGFIDTIWWYNPYLITVTVQLIEPMHKVPVIIWFMIDML